MEAELPPTISKQLKHSLAQYHMWNTDTPLTREPSVIKQLSGGLSNYNFLVEAEQKFVLRIDGIDTTTLGLSRHGEWVVLHRVAEAGLAPTPRYYNPDIKVLVVDYLAPEPNRAANAEDIATFFKQLHSIPPIRFKLDLPQRIRRYEYHLTRHFKEVERTLKPFARRLEKYLEVINSDRTPATLCHNDLNPSNRIFFKSSLWAIDWEYAASGNPWFDIAVAFYSDELPNEDLKKKFLISYLEEKNNFDESMRKIQLYSIVYTYLEILWNVVALKRLPEDKDLTVLDKCLEMGV